MRSRPALRAALRGLRSGLGHHRAAPGGRRAALDGRRAARRRRAARGRLAALALVLGALALPACGDAETEIRPYDNNDLELITGYTAKEMCSCLFVMERDEAYCAEWTKADPAVASYRVDREAKTVQAAALLMWGGRARYVDARGGCVLE